MRRRYQHQTISQRIFGSLSAAAETIFSTYSYVDRLHSPKSAERNRRGCGEKFIVEGLNIRRPVFRHSMYHSVK